MRAEKEVERALEQTAKYRNEEVRTDSGFLITSAIK